MMFRLADGVSMEQINGSLFLSSKEGDISGLNATGSVFLECLLEFQDKNAAAAMIAEMFETDNQDVDTDCLCLLNELIDLGLVVAN
ncbi:PqqD family protein [Denitrobacterium detoxificans]|jgi:hypothetical protein|uniref:PqqD family protein n=1 Tax=Denitrobacterium detoxificans TaxID=79604 RepID=UPI0026F20679|nr:PqqD family protein [Denitrobacterium detoxificans]MBE6465397.1 PqqD family protein [Denitrobacterium detoxificans]